MKFIDNFMKNKIAIPIAATFPDMLPQQVGVELLYAAAVVFIVRASSLSIFVGRSWMEPQDIMGMLLIAIGILGFVMRRRGLSCSLASIAAGSGPVLAEKGQRVGWTWVWLTLLVFNLFWFFPGDIYYTMDTVAFFILACTTYLQELSPLEKIGTVADSISV